MGNCRDTHWKRPSPDNLGRVLGTLRFARDHPDPAPASDPGASAVEHDLAVRDVDRKGAVGWDRDGEGGSTLGRRPPFGNGPEHDRLGDPRGVRRTHRGLRSTRRGTRQRTGGFSDPRSAHPLRRARIGRTGLTHFKHLLAHEGAAGPSWGAGAVRVRGGVGAACLPLRRGVLGSKRSCGSRSRITRGT